MTNELPEMMGRLGSQLDCFSAMLDAASKHDCVGFERARQAFWANAVPAPRWSAKPEPEVSALTGDHRLSQGGTNGRA
jgi:hypothetical protein